MNNNDLSLIDFIKLMWRYKIAFIFISSFCFLASIIYCSLVTPVYKAEVTIIPPKASIPSILNEGHTYSKASSLKEYDLNEIYQNFTMQLDSQALRSDFFNFYLSKNPGLKGKLNFKKFSQEITIKFNPPVKYTVSVKAETKKEAKEKLNAFLVFAEKKAKLILEEDISTEKKNNLSKIDKQIRFVRSLNETKYNEKLTHLKYSLRIAEAAGIQASTLTSPLTGEKNSMYYLVGSKIIQLEIEYLKSQKKKFLSSAYLNTLEDVYNFYNQLTLIYPKYEFMGTLGLLLGFLMSFMLIVFHSVFINKQAQRV